MRVADSAHSACATVASGALLRSRHDLRRRAAVIDELELARIPMRRHALECAPHLHMLAASKPAPFSRPQPGELHELRDMITSLHTTIDTRLRALEEVRALEECKCRVSLWTSTFSRQASSRPRRRRASGTSARGRIAPDETRGSPSRGALRGLLGSVPGQRHAVPVRC